MLAAVGWAVIVGALLIWQGIGLFRPDWPVLTDLFRAILRNPAGRWFLFGLWLWVGWHFFVRTWPFFAGSDG